MGRVEHIGRATLYLGDSLKVMPGLGQVDHIICDPPYEAALHASNDKLSVGRALRDKRNPFRELGFGCVDSIRDEVIACAAVLSKGWFIAFCTLEGIAVWADAINQSEGIKYKRPCLWVKPDAMPQFNGQCPGIGAEAFVTAWAGTGRSYWNAGGKVGVYTHIKGGPERHGEHPTEKPRRLMAEILADFTNPGETILDPFMGSGSTLIAADAEQFNAIGCELSPEYAAIAERRIRDAAGMFADVKVAA